MSPINSLNDPVSYFLPLQATTPLADPILRSELDFYAPWVTYTVSDFTSLRTAMLSGLDSIKIVLTADIDMNCNNWLNTGTSQASFVIANRSVWIQGGCNKPDPLQPAGYPSITTARLSLLNKLAVTDRPKVCSVFAGARGTASIEPLPTKTPYCKYLRDAGVYWNFGLISSQLRPTSCATVPLPLQQISTCAHHNTGMPFQVGVNASLFLENLEVSGCQNTLGGGACLVARNGARVGVYKSAFSWSFTNGAGILLFSSNSEASLDTVRFANNTANGKSTIADNTNAFFDDLSSYYRDDVVPQAVLYEDTYV